MLDTNKKTQNEERIKNAQLFFLGMAGFTLVAGIYFSFVLYQRNAPWQYQSTNVQAFLITFASLVAYWLLKQKQLILSVFLVLGVTASAVIVTALHFGGMDIILALVLLLMYLAVSGSTLPRKIAEQVIVASIFLSVVVGFIGFWDPFKRAYYPPDFVSYLFGVLLLIAYVIYLNRQYRRYSLHTKLILSFLLISSAGIGVAFAVANLNMNRVLLENGRQRLLAEAESAADNIDAFISYSTDSIESAAGANYISLRALLSLEADERRDSVSERQVQNLLYALKNRDPDILSYGILDLEGTVIVDSRTSNIGTSEAHLEHFLQKEVYSSGFVSSVLYLPEQDESVFFISIPLYGEMGLKVGTLRVKYKASILQKLLAEEANRHENMISSNAFYMLFDQHQVVLAHQISPELIGKTPASLSDAEFQELQQLQVVPTGQNASTLSFDLPGLSPALEKMEEASFFEAEDTDINTELTGAIIELSNAPWTIAAMQYSDDFLFPVRRQAQIFFSLAMGAVLFAIIAGSWLSRLFTTPIVRLQTMAQNLTEGDLDAHITIETEDEVGQLADTFNTLASRLKEMVTSLEDRVQERTNDLELRSRYLEGAAEIGKLATTFTDAEELSRTVVELIRERFDLYYVGLFLADENEAWAVLRAGTGVAGEIMLSNNHRLKIGEGMIGWTVRYGEARIALDVGGDAVRFDNPVLPETRSEGALPLRSRGRVLGAISVQSRDAAAFSLDILTTLQTMADQIAVAFDNAALLKKSEDALEAERRAYGDLTLASWQDVKKRDRVSAFRVDRNGLVRTLERDSVDARHQVLKTEQALQENGRAVVLPIKSRGHVIGGIRIAKPEDSGKWTKDQLQLVSTISEQLSVALESARLFEDTQLRAQREAIISDISSKVGASIRMDTILKTTVQELGKALSGADISFEITGPEDGEKL